MDVFLDWSSGSATIWAKLAYWCERRRSEARDDEQSRREGLAGWPTRKLSAPITGAAASCLNAEANQSRTDRSFPCLSASRRAGYDFIKTENLYNFDGERGYSLDQGA